MKKIAEQKLQAFSVGTMGGRSLSKKEQEELRKKEEEEAAAHVFKEFVETFQEAPTSSKVWVKAGTYDAGARKEDTSERGKLYKPTSRLDEKRNTNDDAMRVLAPRGELISSSSSRSKKQKSSDKKKSNLELFKEELRQMQEERTERHKYKSVLRERGVVTAEPAFDLLPDVGSYDTGDPNTTNLYLGNLNPKITEQQLMEIFGRYGPLASIKIMWPRSDAEKARGRNCGFVAFMSRKDGERALSCINGKEIMSYEMKLGWGKAVVIPPVPIYIPPSLLQPSQPPPRSGLPFNAQPPKHLADKIPRVRLGEYCPSDPEDAELYDKILQQSIVKVVVPTERNILMLIHRMVEFVIREGPMFEAIIMNKEMNNPFFRFLFENQSPAHVYYRWRLFSMLQGDTPKLWTGNHFRMFKGGSVWRPPVMNLYTAGMPDELVEEEDAKESMRGTLSNSQRERLEDLIRNLTPSRQSIGEAMAWCLEHAEAANEIAQCLMESMTGPTTAAHKRVARLYLLSDILHNAGAKLTNASAFRGAFQQQLVRIMVAMRTSVAALASRLQQEGVRARVSRVLRAWGDCALYPADLLQRLHMLLTCAEEGTDKLEAESQQQSPPPSPGGSTASSGSWEGGAALPLDGAALRRLAAQRDLAAPSPALAALAAASHSHALADIDGVPVDEDIDGIPLDGQPVEASSAAAEYKPGFIPSKWESVEPAQVQAEAVTTEKWSTLEEPPSSPASPPPSSPPAPPPPPPPSTLAALAGDTTPGHHDNAEEQSLSRSKLREIELRVVQYSDELESGTRAIRPGLAAASMIHHYRRKLIKKAIKEAKEAAIEEVRESPDVRRRSPADEDTYSISSKKSKKSREISLSPPPKRSRHSERTRSRSRSRERERERERAREHERDRERERDRDRERERERADRERRRRSPATPPGHHHRKHKHAKHKY